MDGELGDGAQDVRRIGQLEVQLPSVPRLLMLGVKAGLVSLPQIAEANVQVSLERFAALLLREVFKDLDQPSES